MTIITPEEAQKLLDEATPGPWQKRDCDVVIGDGLTSKTLCHFWRHWSNDEAGIEQTEPNARLTAAAPDLARSLIATHAELTKMTAERDRFAATIVHLVEDRNAEKARADAAEALVKGLRDFVVDFADAKIDALRYSPPHGASPEDEPDPVVDAETVWAWQADAKDAIKAAALAQQPPASGDDGRG